MVTEVTQDCFVTYPGGIIFPSLAVQARYGAGETLNWISLSWVEEASFNTDLASDTFALAVPEQTKVFDERDQAQPRSMTVGKPSSDVVQSVADEVQRRGEGIPRRGWGLVWFTAVNLGFLSVVLVLVLWRKHRAMAR
jgi:hypothetical protein